MSKRHRNYLRKDIFIIVRKLRGRLEKGSGHLYRSALFIGGVGHPHRDVR